MNKPRFKNGEQVGRYRIQRDLGAGAMGLVYLATDDTGYEVALKFLLIDGSEGRARLGREAASAARIQHPNVVRIYKVDHHLGEEPFIVSEYVVGSDLTKVGTRTLDETLSTLHQIAAGLAAAHAAGVVHRDIKPANVLLKIDGTAVIVDFGLGKSENIGPKDPTQVNLTDDMIVGTFSYMSPEQMSGKEVKSSSDIFSFGLLAFELLTGRNLFQRNSAPETVLAVYQDKIPRIIDERPDLPAHIAEILDRCLIRESDLRPTAGQVARQIDTSAETLWRTPSGVRGSFIAHPPTTAGSNVFPVDPLESSAATVQRAIDAVKQVRTDREALVGAAIAEITRMLEERAPKALSGHGNADDLVRSLERTVDCVRDAAVLAVTIAAMADGDAARAQYQGLARLLEGYDQPAGHARVDGLPDVDYCRFLGYELLLGQVAALIREKRWSMIDDVLNSGITIGTGEADGTKVVFFDYFSEYLESLEPLARKKNRVSLHADLLHTRHTEGPLSDASPFHELIAADFFLFLRTELSAPNLIWRPWTAPYFREVPRFVLDVERDHTGQVASALGITDAGGIRDRLLTLAVRLALLRRAGLLSIPLRTEELHQIS